MKINKQFVKLLLIAITCDLLIILGYVLIKLDVDYYYMNPTMDSLGFFILWHVFGYVHKHELKKEWKQCMIIGFHIGSNYD